MPMVSVEPVQVARRSLSSAAAADRMEAEIAALASLDLAALRVMYRNRSGRIAPARISRSLLVRVLAYHIQARACGDLKPDTRRLLDRLGSAAADDAEAGSSSMVPPAEHWSLKPGTLLSREWRGRIERVMALEHGFAWNGTSYGSLSAVALAITGTKWNGFRFFGLRNGRSGPATKGPRP